MLTAVITGVCGQDGSYLAEHLLKNGYLVIGITRRRSTGREYENINHLLDVDKFKFIEGDVTDATLINRVLHQYSPDEWYNLAAQSNVGHSFREPMVTFDVNAKSVIMQLESIRINSPHIRFYQASTSELWGGLECPEGGYSESMSFHPRSPYGVSKLAAYWAVVNYREAYGMFACNGILHNHSSPRRGLDFATRKITDGVARVKLGLQDKLRMGNLSAFRDEGHSADFVKAMHLMLQQEVPDDYVIATSEGATIKEMFEYVCEIAELDFNDVYEMDERFMRPSEVPVLLGNSRKAREHLEWKPEYTWKALLREMYENDLNIWRKRCHLEE
jgi:GDPmannose 4,6-dehydratase